VVRLFFSRRSEESRNESRLSAFGTWGPFVFFYSCNSPLLFLRGGFFFLAIPQQGPQERLPQVMFHLTVPPLQPSVPHLRSTFFFSFVLWVAIIFFFLCVLLDGFKTAHSTPSGSIVLYLVFLSSPPVFLPFFLSSLSSTVPVVLAVRPRFFFFDGFLLSQILQVFPLPLYPFPVLL